MTPFEHSVLSVRDFGGLEKDYLDIHEFLDSTKGSFASWQHRAVLHNSFGMLLCEKIFGATRTNSERIWGKYKLSNKAVVHFEMIKGESWYQWGSDDDDLKSCVTRTETLCNRWLEKI